MVPPGDNLEFVESEYFKKRVSVLPEIASVVTLFLKVWPNAGVDVGGGFRQFEIEIMARKFSVLDWRKKNRIGLYRIFEHPMDDAELDLTLKELAKRGKEKP